MNDLPKILSFFWYKKEQYLVFRSACIDGHVLPETYEDWLQKTMQGVHQFESQGVTVIKAEADIDDFRAWCAFSGHKLDAKGRTAFANLKAVDYLRRKQGHKTQ